jgi:hypothetical protein
VPEPAKHPKTPHDKALALNLDSNRYGTFAEIGAGQEVVRWFFQAGAAAGTIAKSMSAYDMTVSDAIYGRAKRYVSRERLESMLDHEHGLNLTRLEKRAAEGTALFAFADTVAARSYRGGSECHAWMGIRFQARANEPDSQIIIHVRMLDDENREQQEALGIVGVNLVYGASCLHEEPESLLQSLIDGLTTSRIEIDMIEFSGHAFEQVDNRVMALRLVHLGLCGATMFAAGGQVLQPSEVLYKKPVLVERGSFRPATLVNVDILQCAQRLFTSEADVGGDEHVIIAELTIANLLADGELDLQDFIDRADSLLASGITVLISDSSEYYRLCSYLSRYTDQKIGVALGVDSLIQLFDESRYEHLEGGILEAFGRLFKNNVKLYIYPMRNSETRTIISAESIEIPAALRPLYEYLMSQGHIEPIRDYREDLLDIRSKDIRAMIESGQSGWEESVPPALGKLVKERGLFGWPRP